MPTVGIGIPGREDYVQKEDNEGEQLIEFLGVRLYLKDIKNDGSILFNYYEASYFAILIVSIFIPLINKIINKKYF